MALIERLIRSASLTFEGDFEFSYIRFASSESEKEVDFEFSHSDLGTGSCSDVSRAYAPFSSVPLSASSKASEMSTSGVQDHVVTDIESGGDGLTENGWGGGLVSVITELEHLTISDVDNAINAKLAILRSKHTEASHPYSGHPRFLAP